MFLKIAIVFLSICLNTSAKHLYPEKYYQDIWCKEQKGITEYKLIDNTRIDCLTKTQAVEFDFASKWAEAVGQSLHYARMTQKQPAIALIIENKEDYKHYHKLEPLCKKYEIALYQIHPPKEPIENQDNIEQFYLLIKQILLLFFNLIKNFMQ